MMQIVPFEAAHLRMMNFQPAQQNLDTEYLEEHAACLTRSNIAYTAVENGRVVASGGIVEKWQGVAFAWFFFDQDVGGRSFVHIHKTVQRFTRILLKERYHRIECTVDVEHREGRRWMDLLGFTLEGMLRKYGPDGRDHFIYARCNDDGR
jgi:RimJ/RimL family protein N-acetyltransferase